MQESEKSEQNNDPMNLNAPFGVCGASRTSSEGAERAGTTSSIRVPANPSVRVLRYGIDSLRVSVKGTVYYDVRDKLQAVKECAQSDDPRIAATAQYAVGDHFFEMKDKGGGGYGFHLADNAFYIKINKSKNLKPVAIVEVASEYLTKVGIVQAYEEMQKIINELVVVEEIKVSRADPFVDFITDFDFSTLLSKDIVTRGRTYVRYEEPLGTYTVSAA